MKQNKKLSLKAEHNNQNHNKKWLMLEILKKCKIAMHNVLKALTEN